MKRIKWEYKTLNEHEITNAYLDSLGNDGLELISYIDGGIWKCKYIFKRQKL